MIVQVALRTSSGRTTTNHIASELSFADSLVDGEVMIKLESTRYTKEISLLTRRILINHNAGLGLRNVWTKGSPLIHEVDVGRIESYRELT